MGGEEVGFRNPSMDYRALRLAAWSCNLWAPM